MCTFLSSIFYSFSSYFRRYIIHRIFQYFKGLNYKDVNDPACVVTFPLLNDPEVSLLAWTTTPWTLPSNLGMVPSQDTFFFYMIFVIIFYFIFLFFWPIILRKHK